MWIKSLEVTDCAGIASASVDLEPGLNVLHGPNELGKSTLVKAIRAALLLQSSSTAADELHDWQADAPPTVTLTFEQEAQRIWRVRKRFGSGGFTYLDFSCDGEDFSQDYKGREVDGELRNILRWGIEAPGGRGGKRGVPESFITTALLGEQSDVVAILGRSLAGDPADSGRERLTEALQAMAEDPRFKRVVAAVQDKVDEAFTATGRKRSGQASPWARIREQRRDAEANETNVRHQVEDSEGARLRIEEFSRELLEAQAEQECARALLDDLRSARDQRRERAAAEEELAVAETEVERIQDLFARRDATVAAVRDARKEGLELEAVLREAKVAGDALAPRVEAARQSVGRLETGADEQQRRLREEETRNRLLTLEHRRKELGRDLERANELATLDAEVTTLAADVEQRETDLGQKHTLLGQAQDASEKDRDDLDDLDLERHCGRHLAAVHAARAAEAAFAAAENHAEQAASHARDAEAAREEADAFDAPTATELDRLRTLDTDLRIARARLAVGLVVDVALQRAGDAEVTIDGDSRQVRIDAGEQAGFEAKQELRLDLAGIGVVHVRGGDRDLAHAAAAAEQRWDGAAKPAFARTGCATLADLEDLRERADARRKAADDSGRQAAEAQVRAEDIDELERRVFVANAEAKRRRGVLAGHLDENESVDEYAAGLDELPDDEPAIERAIDKLNKAIQEREGLCQRMETRVAGDERDIANLHAQLAGKRSTLAEQGEAGGDWRKLLAEADAKLDGLRRDREATEAELLAIGVEAGEEVDAARQERDDLVTEETRLEQTLAEVNEQVVATSQRLARHEGEAAMLGAQTDGEDLDAARVLRDQCLARLDALPAGDDDIDPAALDDAEHAAAEAGGRVQQLEMRLHTAAGALSQVGGQYIEEQAELARQAVRALDDQERELELEYGAWRLLRETLAEAEQEDAVHLGNALVRPVSERMADLTGGRYGDLAIGPGLDATGIELAGGERRFDGLSVGTQEQIALLLRLSIAEALKTFVILDDQLTQSDPARMAWIRDLLSRVSEDIQVVVMTCHPEDYAVKGRRRNIVDLSSRVRRNPMSTARPRPDGANVSSDGAAAGEDTDSSSSEGAIGSGESVAAERSARSEGSPPAKERRPRRRGRGREEDADDLSAALRSSLRGDEPVGRA